MNRHITIEWPYDQITLEFKPGTLRKQPAPLSTDKWDALAKAERRIYYPGGMGCNGYTDVMVNDGDEQLNEMWSLAATAVDNILDYEGNEARKLHEIASRVAQCYAILNFGAEILLRG